MEKGANIHEKDKKKTFNFDFNCLGILSFLLVHGVVDHRVL